MSENDGECEGRYTPRGMWGQTPGQDDLTVRGNTKLYTTNKRLLKSKFWVKFLVEELPRMDPWRSISVTEEGDTKRFSRGISIFDTRNSKNNTFTRNEISILHNPF